MEGYLTFQWGGGGVFFRWGGASFLSGGGGATWGGATVLMGGFQKKCWMGGGGVGDIPPMPPHYMGNPGNH